MAARHRASREWIWTSTLFAFCAISCSSETKQSVPGLGAPVEILRDKWGICHIYADNEHDLFVAQGYAAARDRLFQLELWRRQATGTMAEIQGPRALVHDVGARQLKFRGDLKRELLQYHPRGPEIVAAFVEGVNAYIELCEREPSRLPIEFRILAIKPAKWTPEIVVSRHNALVRNVTDEVQYAQLVHVLGSERTKRLFNLHPGDPTLKFDPALDLSLVSEQILDTYKASRSPVTFRPEDVEARYRGQESRRGADRKAAALDIDDDSAVGSNNWVIAAERTAAKSAIMASDPHRLILLPSLRYWVHLVAPGWNVIGAGEPALPGVSAGHNEHGAWGFTIFPVDQEDLYVLEVDPAKANSYRYRGQWEPMQTMRETIGVKGSGAVEVELKFTRHGPVIFEDMPHHRAYALKAVWLEAGTAPYLASLRLDQAKSWDEFREGCRSFFVPSENMVWADVDGHIGWQAVGLAPRRPNWEGLLPVPGDGRFEWDGFVPIGDLPHVTDPPRGWFATANQDNLPRDYPFQVSYQWVDAFRFHRIEEVLAEDRRFTVADMTRLQHDELALPARSLVPLLRGLKPAQGKAQAARDRLLEWDFVLNQDSVTAAIYVAWERELKRHVWNLVVPRAAQSAFPVRFLSTELLIDWLSRPDERLGPDPRKTRDELLARALEQAVAELEKRLGPDMSRWRYGQDRFKHVRLRHPLSGAVNAQVRAQLDLGPVPRGGYAYTVNATSNDDNQSAGASFRIVADTGDWDRSVGTNTPGQSGDPNDPHYGDLLQPWAAGEYFPVSFSRAKVESVVESRTTLVP
jgi:penicillin G amidase